ncbi:MULTISPECIES: hypothetical protein [unclassified Rhodococcus (in: high G+C Gram-positive bacteria)]|uniref:hypothetical protein n=1 Tax=unclassified Rhodococcus (in: high G+C Gram-positive bacteria) TaxID=192944 RepID=UPI00117B45F3|nr:hypothetical protein [Rhodococcus sp. 1163]
MTALRPGERDPFFAWLVSPIVSGVGLQSLLDEGTGYNTPRLKSVLAHGFGIPPPVFGIERCDESGLCGDRQPGVLPCINP